MGYVSPGLATAIEEFSRTYHADLLAELAGFPTSQKRDTYFHRELDGSTRSGPCIVRIPHGFVRKDGKVVYNRDELEPELANDIEKADARWIGWHMLKDLNRAIDVSQVQAQAVAKLKGEVKAIEDKFLQGLKAVHDKTQQADRARKPGNRKKLEAEGDALLRGVEALVKKSTVLTKQARKAHDEVTHPFAIVARRFDKSKILGKKLPVAAP